MNNIHFDKDPFFQAPVEQKSLFKSAGVRVTPLNEESRKFAEKFLSRSIECFETIVSDNSPLDPEGLREELYHMDRRFHKLNNSLKTTFLHLADEKGISNIFLEKHREELNEAKDYLLDIQAQVEQYAGIKSQVLERLPESLYLRANIDNLSKVEISSVQAVLESIKRNREELGVYEIKTLQNDLDEANAILQHFCHLSIDLKSEEEITRMVEVIKSFSLEILNGEKKLTEKKRSLKNRGNKIRIGRRLAQESLLEKIQRRIVKAEKETNPNEKPYIYVTDQELSLLENV